MKQLMIYVAAIVFSVVSVSEATAQGRGKAHEKARKEHAKYHEKRQKAAYKRDKEIAKSYREYYKERDKAYRAYVKRENKRYRDHDRWYYDRRFHRRSDYVYFPAYRTYYDPYRRGYVYWRNSGWVFAQTMPSFMVGINLGAANVQFMANLPI
ncbi:hypothetical protein JHJ32_12670 [Parapedobacter sp. ISTM3]|uniref:Uncharacterized protein n=1 Tax=Parapedobacter luteus TaxID=623280 RepID=A0A1T5DS44_9SPHI|nr:MULTISPECIES: hypothetical protein [Parapedobacter]MBK1440845.1 hypothetical protein [Parapedobacter sp. ISTM3]SKB74548.1 hypothetical protein SAMN05660226_02944 [Parapedobacter luteus]